MTPALGSTCFHTCLLLICALVSCDRQSGSGPEMVAEIGELPSETLTDSVEESLDSETTEESNEDADEMLLEVAVVIPDVNAVSTASLDQTLAELMPSGASGGSLSEIGSVGGGSGGLGEGVSFMGVKSFGNRICVIADSSGSMQGPKLDYVKDEIYETISSLPNSKKFQLFFFSTRSIPFPHNGWRHPKRDIKNVQAFLNDTSPMGGTMPLGAFQDAFALTPPPDVIYFMTDGLFPDDVVNAVDAMNTNRPKVQINTISFVDDSAQALMEKMAKDSKGTYTHVASP